MMITAYEREEGKAAQDQWEDRLTHLRAGEADFGKWIIVVDVKYVVEQASRYHGIDLEI